MQLKKWGIRIVLWLLAMTGIGYFVHLLVTGNLLAHILSGNWRALLVPSLLVQAETYLYGAVVLAVGLVLHLAVGKGSWSKPSLGGKPQTVDGPLENSRFMTDKERDFNFSPYLFTKLEQSKKDGVPVRAVFAKKELKVNLSPPMHGLIIGATGSGKTTTFINPMIQILASSSAGSSLIMTDPKGELFQLHSKRLVDRGYKVMVLDLRDPYSSFRWNPLEDIYDRYQLYLQEGDDIYQHTDDVVLSGLTLVAPVTDFSDEWFEFDGKAYADGKALIDIIRTRKAKLFDELYEDLNDLVGVLCPIESKDDPVWEKGARSIIMATILAMLEDSGDPRLGMTKQRFNFYNVNKAMGNSDENFLALRNYFAGRAATSRSVSLSKQVLSAAESTLASYMSIAFDKLSLFNDEGLCALTGATDIVPSVFADEKAALFLKIPDEKDTRHGLAAIFILCIYKALIKKASTQEDLSLPRNVYFILDEFGNMPKIDKFDKMITVGRSRKIWFNMVVQSYAQLNNVYGDTIADIVKSNCGIKMFIGSNDIGTCKEFSELCGNMSVTTTSVSRSANDQSGNANYSTSVQTRPLIYPSDLQKLNNKVDTGNAIIVTFGNYPLRTKFTPSYKCPLYKVGTMDLSDVRSNSFFADDIYYDLQKRNKIVLE